MVDRERRLQQKRDAAKRYYASEKGQARRSKVLEYLKQYYIKNRDRRLRYEKARYSQPNIRIRSKDNQFRRMYGITIDQYNARLSEQGGVCAICRKAETAMYRGQIKMLSVDHDHETGAVRGLLCANCNILLGAARDDTEIMRRAVEYLSPTGG